MAAFNFHRRRTRRWWYSGVTLVALAFFTVFFVVAASGNSTVPLSGSTFEGGDGNLVTDVATQTDWCTQTTAQLVNGACTAPIAGLQKGIDLASGSGDNSFGQGTKEDASAVTVVSGSIPPQKSDLTRFYEASQNINNNTFLYLAWERTNNLGNANMDFEINKNGTGGCPGTTAGACTISRTNGDVLVTYDFSGSGTPTLGILRWLTVGGLNPTIANNTTVFNSNSDCFSANTLPCWGDQDTLNSTNSQGAVDTGAAGVADPIGPNAPRTIVQNGFGEAAINLTAAGIVSSGSCDFGSATTFLKSRSSSAFTSEIKDFIAPISTPITPCAKLTVIKHTLNAAGTRSGINANFTYTPSSNLNSGNTFTLNDGAGATGDVTCPVTSGTCNTQVFSGLGADTYTVTESDPSPGFALTGLSCVNTGTTTTHGTTSTTTRQASVALVAGDDVTCTYTNQQQTGAIKITKVSSKGSSPLAGAQFTYALVTGGVAGTATNFPSLTDANGHACVAGLPFGTYQIAESSAPAGYAGDATNQNVTVSAVGTCTTGTQATPTNSFVDTPLSKIYLGWHSLAGTGVTTATIQCTGEASASAFTDGGSPAAITKTLGDGSTTLTPGTYSCTVVIDP